MLEQDQPPDTISTDIHAYSIEAAVDLPTVMSKFLALGMSLADILDRVTRRPAQAAGLDMGHLRIGSEANVAVLRINDERIEFPDTYGGIMQGNQRMEAVMTFCRGRLRFDRLSTDGLDSVR